VWKKLITIAIVTIGVVGLALLGYVASLVDDWSRDLSQNVAETSSENPDETLHPITANLSAPELADLVVDQVKTIANWKLVERTQTNGDSIQLHFVRTTSLLRFKDDIHVTIMPLSDGESNDSGSVLTAKSESRIGKGDLGQNPRNLRELLEKVRQNLSGA
jgi:uncharacterized protein (DUF1499 family)